jgi:hypothetical protein
VRTEAEVVLEGDLGVGHLALAAHAAQLPAELGTLGEAGGSERVSLGNQAPRRVHHPLAACARTEGKKRTPLVSRRTRQLATSKQLACRRRRTVGVIRGVDQLGRLALASKAQSLIRDELFGSSTNTNTIETRWQVMAEERRAFTSLQEKQSWSSTTWTSCGLRPVCWKILAVAFLVMSAPTALMQDFSSNVEGKSVAMAEARISTALRYHITSRRDIKPRSSAGVRATDWR